MKLIDTHPRIGKAWWAVRREQDLTGDYPGERFCETLRHDFEAGCCRFCGGRERRHVVTDRLRWARFHDVLVRPGLRARLGDEQLETAVVSAQPLPEPDPVPPLILELARLEALVYELKRRIALLDAGGLTTDTDPW